MAIQPRDIAPLLLLVRLVIPIAPVPEAFAAVVSKLALIVLVPCPILLKLPFFLLRDGL